MMFIIIIIIIIMQFMVSYSQCYNNLKIDFENFKTHSSLFFFSSLFSVEQSLFSENFCFCNTNNY